jgi:5-azacytidine-induced protein 1
LKKQENWVIQKERELKEQIKRERDKEIELLISRLESETATSREEADRTADNRIKLVLKVYFKKLSL